MQYQDELEQETAQETKDFQEDPESDTDWGSVARQSGRETNNTGRKTYRGGVRKK